MDGQDLQDKKGPWWEGMEEFLATNGEGCWSQSCLSCLSMLISPFDWLMPVVSLSNGRTKNERIQAKRLENRVAPLIWKWG